MAKALRNALLAAAAAGTLLATGAGPAQADTQEPPAGQSLPGNWMYLAVMQGESVMGDLDGHLLRCPPRGDHAAGDEAACAALKKAKGDIGKAAPLNIACPMIYKPVTAVAYGVWNGRRQVFAQNFPNSCVMKDRTGGIFGTHDK
ncbi:SSI family serine proteinase inhibitor [Streptomyces sp. NPDC059009]|uniref:SSI family serine proteinase inhibitor n=1 Tax=Streptomyces sp. NPDC059009 TaxID=3346694 RepID=UPI0036D01DF2